MKYLFFLNLVFSYQSIAFELCQGFGDLNTQSQAEYDQIIATCKNALKQSCTEVCDETSNSDCNNKKQLAVNFINGVQNDYKQAFENGDKIREILKKFKNLSGIQEPNVCIKVAYNQTNGILDFAEVVIQKVRERTEAAGIDFKFEYVTAILLNIRDFNSQIFPNNNIAKGFSEDYLEALNNHILNITEIEQKTLLEVIYPIVERDIQEMPNIIVSHSQGNLFANLLHDEVKKNLGETLVNTTYANLQVGTAASETSAKIGNYYTSKSDNIINPLSIIDQQSLRDSNIWIVDDPFLLGKESNISFTSSLQKHSFIDFYTNDFVLGSFDEEPSIDILKIEPFLNKDRFKPMDKIFYEELQKLALQIVPIDQCNEDVFKLASNFSNLKNEETQEEIPNNFDYHLNGNLNIMISTNENTPNFRTQLICERTQSGSIKQINEGDLPANGSEIAIIFEKDDLNPRMVEYIPNFNLIESQNKELFFRNDNTSSYLVNNIINSDIDLKTKTNLFNIDEEEIDSYLFEVSFRESTNNDYLKTITIPQANNSYSLEEKNLILSFDNLTLYGGDIQQEIRTANSLNSRYIYITKKYKGNKKCDGFDKSLCPYSTEVVTSNYDFSSTDAKCSDYISYISDNHNNYFLSESTPLSNIMMDTVTSFEIKSVERNDFGCTFNTTKNFVTCLPENKSISKSMICGNSYVENSILSNTIVIDSDIKQSIVRGSHSNLTAFNSEVSLSTINSTIIESTVGRIYSDSSNTGFGAPNPGGFYPGGYVLKDTNLNDKFTHYNQFIAFGSNPNDWQSTIQDIDFIGNIDDGYNLTLNPNAQIYEVSNYDNDI